MGLKGTPVVRVADIAVPFKVSLYRSALPGGRLWVT